MNNHLIYKIALTMVPLVGPKLARNLIAYCGSPEAVFTENKRHLVKIPGIGTMIADSIAGFNGFARAEKELEFVEKNKINVLFYLDEDYPERLRDLEDAPLILYFKGNSKLNKPKVLGIVGTRKASNYGKNFCNNIVEALKDYNPLIISGLAFGIDYCAHKAALANQLETVAVLGHGLDTLYPSQHRSIALEMIEKGGLITEFISGTTPEKQNFPQRNRIVAGMIDALLVVETGVRGGALITAEITNSYNREVFAVPGRIDDDLSAGCNNLIKKNKACLIENVADIAFHLGWDIIQKQHNDKKNVIAMLDEQEKLIYNFIKNKDKIHIDQIAAETGKTISELSVLLLELEFKGLLITLPGKFYKV